MSERADHAAEAVRIMGEDGWATTGIAAAHVHATLALVEQQRIANLIAYHAAGKGSIDGPSLLGSLEQARKALGL